MSAQETQYSATPLPPDEPPRPWRRWGLIALLGGAVVLAAGLSWYFWLRPTFPEIDISEAPPELIQAIEDAKAGVRANPRSATAWGKLGMVLLGNRYFPQAAECFAQAERLDPKNARWPYLQAEVSAPTDPATTIALLERAVAVEGDDPMCRLRLGEMLLEQDRLDEAEQQLIPLLKVPAYRAWGHFRLAQLEVRRNRMPKAVEHLKSAEQGTPAARQLQALWSEIHFRMGDPKAAEQDYHRSRTLPELKRDDPHMAEVNRHSVGVSARALEANKLGAPGQPDGEIAALEETARANPKSLTAQLALAQVLLNASRWDAAADVAARAIALGPDSAAALHMYGYALSKQGKFAPSIDILKKALAKNPNNPATHYQLGFCYYQIGQKDLSVESLRLAIDLRPNFPDAWRALGQIYAERDDPRALECLENAVAQGPDDPANRKALDDYRNRPKKGGPK